MDKDYKTKRILLLPPYLVVREPKKMMELLNNICGATQERKYHEEDCSVLHVELRIDEAVVMIGIFRTGQGQVGS